MARGGFLLPHCHTQGAQHICHHILEEASDIAFNEYQIVPHPHEKLGNMFSTLGAFVLQGLSHAFLFLQPSTGSFGCCVFDVFLLVN